jgi:NTE family protein
MGQRAYAHLQDGGLSDNIGVRAVLDAMEFEHGFIRRRLVGRQIDRLLVIAVNARTTDEPRLRQAPHPGRLSSLLDLADGRLSNYSYESLEAARRVFSRVSAGFGVEACFIELGFEDIADPDRRERLLRLPTTFSLPRNDVEAVIAAGRTVVQQTAQSLEEFVHGRLDGAKCGARAR